MHSARAVTGPKQHNRNIMPAVRLKSIHVHLPTEVVRVRLHNLVRTSKMLEIVEQIIWR